MQIKTQSRIVLARLNLNFIIIIAFQIKPLNLFFINFHFFPPFIDILPRFLHMIHSDQNSRLSLPYQNYLSEHCLNQIGSQLACH